MIRIAITEAAFAAIKATLRVGSAAYEPVPHARRAQVLGARGPLATAPGAVTWAFPPSEARSDHRQRRGNLSDEARQMQLWSPRPASHLKEPRAFRSEARGPRHSQDVPGGMSVVGARGPVRVPFSRRCANRHKCGGK
jgi:hypothetical protein